MSQRRIVIAVLFLPLLLIMLGWFWLGSDSGRGWLADTVTDASGGTLAISGVTGHPLSALAIDKISYSDAGTDVEVKALHLAWSPLQLLFARLAISELEVASIAVHTPESGDESAQDSGSSAMPALPAISLVKLRVGELSIAAGDKAATLVREIGGDGIRVDQTLAGAVRAHLDEPALDMNLAVHGTLKQWQLDGAASGAELGEVELSLTGEQLRQGRIELKAAQQKQRATLAADWKRAGDAVTAKGSADVELEQASISAPWQLNANLKPDLKQSAAELSLDMKAESKELTRPLKLAIKANYAQDALSAQLEETDQGLNLDIRYAADAVEATAALSQWESPFKAGEGMLNGAISGNWQAAGNTWQLTGKIDKSRLAGLNAGLELEGEGKGAAWQLARGELQLLGLNVHARGQGDAERFAMSGDFRAGDIGALLRLAGQQGAKGRLKGDFRADGGYDNPAVTLALQGDQLRLQDIEIKRLNLAGSMQNMNGAATLTLSGLTQGGATQVSQLKLDAGLKDQLLKAKLVTEGKLDSRATLRLKLQDQDVREAWLEQLKLGYDRHELLAAKQLYIERNGAAFRMARHSLDLLGAKSAAEFSLGGRDALLKLDVNALDLAQLEAWIPGMAYRIAGVSDLHIDLSGAASQPKLNVAVQSPELSFAHQMFADVPEKQLKLHAIDIQGSYADRRMRWQLKAEAPAGGSIESRGDYALGFSVEPWRVDVPKKHDGSGSLTARFARLADLEPLMPRIEPFNGSGQIDLSWKTPIGAKSVQGDGLLKFDALGVPEFGLDMSGNLGVKLAHGMPVVDLVLKSGEGMLSVQGAVDVEKRRMPDVKFDRFPLMKLPDQKLTVSGAISASEDDHVGDISGNLEVVHMRLEIPESAPKPTDDLLWQKDEPEAEQVSRTALTRLNVDLSISDDAEIYGRGMSMKPRGNLHLDGSLGAPKLTGVLEIPSGKIEFRSVKLEIQSDSKVIFSGDPARPSIMIRAARKVGDVTAGILVEGPADKLVTTLYSTPGMTNSEIFSYIATGRPLSTLGKDSAGDMMTAAEFILGPGSMMQEVQGKVKQSTGLDVFEVGGDTAGGYVKAGRNLSDKVTLSVEQTVAKESATALTLEYLLTRSVSIFAKQTTNLAPSVGLRYSKEWFGHAPRKGIK